MGSPNPENPPKQELNDSGYVQEDAGSREGPAEAKCPNLLDLSDDVLLCILQYCSPLELKALGFTCSRLGTLILDRTLWQTVDARGEPTGKRRMHWLLTHALSTHTTALRCSGFAKETQCTNNYSSIADRNIGMHRARPQSSQQENKGAEQPQPKPKLTLSPAALLRLTEVCPDLTELVLEDAVIDCKVMNIGMFPKSLRVLSLKGCKCTNQERRSFLEKINLHLVKLEDLDVSYCEWIEPACFMPLSKVPRLRRLVMRHCCKLTEFVAYASLATRYGFKQLKILDLSGSPVGDSEVSALGWVPLLEELYLSPASGPQPAVIELPRDELMPWEEEEPEYYDNKYASQQWIVDEAQPPLLAHHGDGFDAAHRQGHSPDFVVPRVCSCQHQTRPLYPPIARGYGYSIDLAEMLDVQRDAEAHYRNEELNRQNEERNRLNEEDRRNEERNRQNEEDSRRNETAGRRNLENSWRNAEDSRQNEGESRRNEPGTSASSTNQNIGGSGDYKQDKDQTNGQDKDGKKRKRNETNEENDKGSGSTADNETTESFNDVKRAKLEGNVTEKKSEASGSKTTAFSTNEAPNPTYKVCSSNNRPIIEVEVFAKPPNNNDGSSNVCYRELGTERNHTVFGNITVNVEQNSTNPSKSEANLANNKATSSNNEATSSSNGATSSNNGTTSSNNGATSSNNGATSSNNGATSSNNAASSAQTVAFSDGQPSTATINQLESQFRRTIEVESFKDFKRRLLEYRDCILNATIMTADNGEGDSTSEANKSDENDTENDNGSPEAKKSGKKDDTASDSKSNDANDSSSDNDDGPPSKKQKLADNKINTEGNSSTNENGGAKDEEENARLVLEHMHRHIREMKMRLNELGVAHHDSNGASTSAEPAPGAPQPAGNQERQPVRRLVRFRHNQPAIVIDCSCEPGTAPGSDDNHNDAGQPDRHDAAAGGSRPPTVIIPQAPENRDAEPVSRILYVSVGRQRQTMYHISIPDSHRVGANPGPNVPRGIELDFTTGRLEYTSLVTDQSLRNFGRAHGENVNYVHIGPGGIRQAPIRDATARPDRSNLRILSVTGFTHISDRSLNHLATAAPRLQLVDFTGTRVTETGVEHFKNIRPDCEVRFGPAD